MSTNLATQQPGSTVETYLSNSSLNNTSGDLNTIFARCTVANLPTGAGYAVGCIIQASDTGQMYTNLGTTTAANFVLTSAGSGAHPSKAAINATATATAAQVATGYITSTSAAPTTITLPTGALLGPALGATQGTTLELYVDNTAGASTVTMAVAVNGIKSDAANTTAASFGQLTVASGATGIGRFTIMFSSATTYVFTRTA
jgi:hypothetical protein